LGNPEIIAGEDPESSASFQEVSKVLEHSIDTALEREAHDNVGSICSRELRDDVRKERVIVSSSN